MSFILDDLRIAIKRLFRAPLHCCLSIFLIALSFFVIAALLTQVRVILSDQIPFVETGGKNGDLVTIAFDSSSRSFDSYEAASLSRDLRSMEILSFYQNTFIGRSSGSSKGKALGAYIDENFFKLFNIQASLGNLTKIEGDGLRAIISHRLWLHSFNADANIIGMPLLANGKAFLIQGVLPEHFNYPVNHDAWLFDPDVGLMSVVGQNSLSSIGLTAHGKSIQQIELDIEGVYKKIKSQHPDRYNNENIKVTKFTTNSARSFSSVVKLMGLVAVLLALISCLCLASILGSRFLKQEKEWAVLRNIGMKPIHLVRIPFVECTLIVVIGTIIGIAFLLMYFNIAYDYLYVNVERAPFWWKLKVDFHLLISISLAYFLTAYSTCLLIIFLSRSSLEGNRSRFFSMRLRWPLVTAQLLACIIISSAVTYLSFDYYEKVYGNKGFNSSDISVADFRFREDVPRNLTLMFDQMENFRNTLSIGKKNSHEIGYSTIAFGDNSYTALTFQKTDERSSSDKLQTVNALAISEEMLDVMRIELLQGRNFNRFDTDNANKVGIIDKKTSYSIWGSLNVVGERLILNPDRNALEITVVGVVNDLELLGENRNVLLLPMRQSSLVYGGVSMHARVGSPSTLSEIRSAISRLQQIDNRVTISELEPLSKKIEYQGRSHLQLIYNFLPSFLTAITVVFVGILMVSIDAVLVRARDIGVCRAFGLTSTEMTRFFLLKKIVILFATCIAGSWITMIYLPNVLISFIEVSRSFMFESVVAAAGFIFLVSFTLLVLPFYRRFISDLSEC